MEKTSAAFRLHRLFSDGAVLQRGAKVNVRGWAAPGQTVSLRFLGREYRAAAGTDGKWKIVLPALEPGGPYEMEFSAERRVLVRDVWVGDVWLCSGQSNMELPMSRVRRFYPEEIAVSENPRIRFFYVAKEYDFEKDRQDLSSGSWVAANPQSVLQFSAAAYFFAAELQRRQRVPIGILSASVGGSPVQAWLSREALESFPHYWDMAESLKNRRFTAALKKRDEAAQREWCRALDEADAGLKGGRPWYAESFDDSSWPETELPASWEDAGLADWNGALWLRKEVDLRGPVEKQPCTLDLGLIVDADRAYVNGVPVGETAYRYPPRLYPVPAGLLREGKNKIAVRAISVRGKGGFVKGKPYALEIGGASLDLSGPWKYKVGATADPLPEQVFFEHQPGGLYRAMISPLLGYTIRGAAWYQGESNTDHPAEYREMFEKMIADWREKWGQGDFPFLYVQLANYRDRDRELKESDWARLRQAQLEALEVPNTAMAVAVDIGEWNDLHPHNKKEVGRRLAAAAQGIAYRDASAAPMGPIVRSVRREGDALIVGFRYAGGGLRGRRGDAPGGFAVCGPDRDFVRAEAKITGDEVRVRSPRVKHPSAVRYCWADSPPDVDLYNTEGLPASPFQAECP